MGAFEATFTARWFTKIAELEQQVWDRLALPLPTPFLEWEWLFQLEVSGSIGPATGWQPAYLTIWKGIAPENSQQKNQPEGIRPEQLVAAAPFFIKTHSEGEFVFDQPLAQLAEQLQIPYYPKLVGMTPFTPVPGYRFLIDKTEDASLLTEMMLKEVDRFCTTHKLHSCQFNYTAPDWELGERESEFFKWPHSCFNWYNPGLTSFEDYLNLFNKNQRRNIKREREKLTEAGISIAGFKGAEIPDYLFSHMYSLYENTNAKYYPWDCKYLTADFFEGLKAKYKERLLFMAAFQNGPNPALPAFPDSTAGQAPLGMSFFVVKNDNLYGRYWGSYDFADSLHFNLCFYSPIEWALAHQIKHLDPGIGSSHKTRRGFIAVPNYSLHRYYHPGFVQIMNKLINQIDQVEREQIETLNSQSPLLYLQKNTD